MVVEICKSSPTEEVMKVDRLRINNSPPSNHHTPGGAVAEYDEYDAQILYTEGLRI